MHIIHFGMGLLELHEHKCGPGDGRQIVLAIFRVKLLTPGPAARGLENAIHNIGRRQTLLPVANLILLGADLEDASNLAQRLARDQVVAIRSDRITEIHWLAPRVVLDKRPWIPSNES